MKRNINDLAIFGGSRIFPEPLHVGRPNVGNKNRLMQKISDILDQRWFTNNGPYVREFEKKISEFVGVKHCIAMCNATVALEIAIRALEMKGEVIVPSMTFIATAHALQWQKITPVFCDVNPETLTLDPEKVEGTITPQTTGIIGVHLWGRTCDVERLTEIAQRHHLKILFDAAHAFGCSYQGEMVGSFGDAEVFSFHATKFFNTFEGGAVVTNNDELARRIRLMKNFGFEGYDNVVHIGINGKMSEISAAMGLTGLESLNEFIQVNRDNYKRYQKGLKDLQGVTLLTYDEKDQCNYQYIVLSIDEVISGISRDELVRILWKENILARRYFYPGCHRMEPYRSLFPLSGEVLPETEKLLEKVITLPTGSSMNLRDIDKLCQLIEFIVLNAGEIKKRILASNLLRMAPRDEY